MLLRWQEIISILLMRTEETAIHGWRR